MRRCSFFSISFFFLTLLLQDSLTAQSWEFVKEKDGIKIYTRNEAGNILKSYKAIADINAPAEKIFDLIENIKNNDWWDKNLTDIKVLKYEKDKGRQYYMVYSSPWPASNRDICVDVTITRDPVSGESVFNSVAVSDLVPERAGIIRIKDFRQTWTLIPAGKEMTHIILEGYIDPSGNIPDWISNMLVSNSPYKAIVGVRDHVVK